MEDEENKFEDPDQPTLFEMHEDWHEEWQGMPEFISKDLTSHRKITVHFRNDEDVEQFAKLINQAITPKQPSLWFPEMAHRKTSHMIYINAGEN